MAFEEEWTRRGRIKTILPLGARQSTEGTLLAN